MRTVAITCGMSLALVLASWLSGFTQQPQVPPQPLGAAPVAPPQSGQGGEVQVLSTAFASGVQQIVYVDTRQQTMAVYHIQAGTGKLELKSVRKIAGDVALEQFNTLEPLPSDMRLLRQ